MNTKTKIIIAAVAGAGLGAAAMQGLHAQSKLKAYSIGELEVIGDASNFSPDVVAAFKKFNGRSLRTLNGRVVSIEGEPAPKNVGIIEWDSVDDAVGFFESKAWTELAPQREKYEKTIRRYIVEVEK